MKKMLLGLSLAVAALAFLMPSAMAAASPPALSISDQAFLASLAARVGTPAPELAAKRPAIGLKSFCSANCWDTGTVSCSGTSCSAVNGSCPGEPGHVTCDTTTYTCPNPCPSCPPDWCTGEEACAIQCTGCEYNYTCNDYPLCNDHCHCILRTCYQ